MSSLLLVRHGQASFGAADYDQLSPLGERQAQRVGERLARERPRVAALYSGPRKRHLQTAERLLAAARAAGADYPDIEVVEDLDELPIREIMLLAMPRPDEDLMSAVIDRVRRWVEGELTAPEMPTPADFVARIEGALERLMPGGPFPSVLVTSGGPIAVPLFRAEVLRDVAEAFSRGLQLANGSLSEFSREAGRLRLLPGDPVAHLRADEITQV